MMPHPKAERLVMRAQECVKGFDMPGAWRLLSRAVERYPEIPDVHLHMALFLAWVDDAPSGLKIIRALRQRVPDRPLIWLTEQAIAAHTDDLASVRAIHDDLTRVLPPAHAYVSASHIQVGMLMVKRGLWREGFAHTDHEFLARRRTLRAVGEVPPWQGQTDPDGTLFIYWDQGLGDTMLHARFLQDAKRIWKGRVVFDVQPVMKRWAGRWSGPDEVMATGDDQFYPKDATRKLSITGLPFACDISTDAEVSRYGVLCDVPAAEDVPHDMVNVGICWRGSDEFTKNDYRSIPFTEFRTLLGIEGVRYWSFQFGKYEAECDDPDVVQVARRATDYWDTCRYLRAMDLTISVDTSVVNAAGATGSDAWVLVWNPIETRWGTREQGKGLWYPQIRPYWREPQNAWSPVLQRVRNDLAQFVTRQASSRTI
jgi:hypothetical protein